LKRQPPDFRVYSRPVRPGPPAFVASLCLLCACGPATPNPARPGAPTAAELELPPADKNLVLERSTTAQNGQPDPILEAMQAELGRARSELGKQPSPPYYIAYGAYATRTAHIVAS